MRRQAIDASLSPDLLRSTMQARDKDASSWLSAVPLEEQDLTLNKQQSRDSLRLRYNLQRADLPSHCTCGDRFTVNRTQSSKKRSFVARRHDGIRNLLTPLLRSLDVEMGSFTPYGFWHEQRNGERMQTFPDQSGEQTFPKERRVLCQCHWLRIRISFEILKSVDTCV